MITWTVLILFFTAVIVSLICKKPSAEVEVFYDRAMTYVDDAE